MDQPVRNNIAPQQWILIIREREGERVPQLARWGLVPNWYEVPSDGPNPFNIRAEGIRTKPMFRAPLRHGRCLIPASGFYEWKRLGKTKVPYYVRPRGGGFFLFAGLFDTWSGPEGDLTTCAIITTSANSLMQSIHDRMPVILSAEMASAWLNPGEDHPDRFLQAFPSELMETWEVDAMVGNARHDGAGLIEPIRE